MGWRSRREDREQALKLTKAGEGSIEEGEKKISLGQEMIKKGRAAYPKELDWAGFLVNPFATSEYNLEQIIKGIVYMGGGMAVAFLGVYAAELHQDLTCCNSLGLMAGGLYVLAGMAHAHAGFKQ